ncbi:hypothetical protein BDP55DRAFT_629842 [Colletotrichum godetiae]|uniref:NodB homology domain-containing protein n=1 Tax=Colletotrichum godetiae TaxID=1209918 RepID=A0AAJ0APZ7_9PEZI|nr:uncharacterized protein BDP55DRAFT_629842 [Colletotrichum godetiae]KAK1688236.1 hypothetical protein BDP55DRAFT_629842 [Colletotrichum godetiae]
MARNGEDYKTRIFCRAIMPKGWGVRECPLLHKSQPFQKRIWVKAYTKMSPRILSKHGQVIRKCTVPGTVAFTFDDDSWTEKDDILSLFSQRNAQASFFLRSTPWTTDVIKDNGGESGIQKLHDNGHLIGLGTSSRRHHSDAEQQDLLKARQKVSIVLGTSSTSDGLRPQYIWSSPSDCTVRNGCVEKLTINGQRLVLWDAEPADMGNNTETTLLLDRVQAADPKRDSFLVPIRGLRKENHHGISDLLDGFLQKGFRPVTVGDCTNDPKHFWYLDHLGHPATGLEFGHDVEATGTFLSQIRWGGLLAVIFLELMALSCLFWAVCRYRKIKSHQRIVQ